eukprot:9495367-Pyramimonas_sp.AAC.1
MRKSSKAALARIARRPLPHVSTPLTRFAAPQGALPKAPAARIARRPPRPNSGRPTTRFAA